jgi:hypothetical protein
MAWLRLTALDVCQLWSTADKVNIHAGFCDGDGSKNVRACQVAVSA